MNIFASLVTGPAIWRVRHKRFLSPWEKLNIVSATVVASDYGYKAECLTKKGDKRYVPISAAMEVTVGMQLNINDIEVLTLTNGHDSIIRIEF